MLTEDKFFEKGDKFMLFPTTDGKYFTYEELETTIKESQTDKEGKMILLYASDKEEQHSYIKMATDKGYKAIYLDGVATNTGVIEIPLAAANGVTLTGTQILTNKTFRLFNTSPTLQDQRGPRMPLPAGKKKTQNRLSYITMS